MTVMPRAATSDELTKLRSIQQRSALYLTVQPAVTVYTARLAAVPTSTDKVLSITYNSGSGDYTKIVQDQTLLIGTTAGGFDLGSVRIRNLSGLGVSSGTINIGQTSNVNWQANAYLTVLDEFQIWRRDPRVLDDGTGTIFMDWDIAYSDQHAHCLSIPVLGPPAVKWLTGASVTVKFDASQSWALGNTITGYAWVAPGTISTTGLTTATPTMTYNATGMYRVACTITNSDGVSYTGYRYVFIINNSSTAPLLITQFELDSLSGDYNNGGWSAQITLAAETDLSTIRDRSLAILHTRDWYGPKSSDEGSVGYVDDRENIALVGWIALESDLMGATGRWNTTTFTIHGPAWFLDKPSSYPITLKDKNVTVTKWTRFFGVSARAFMWHVFMWRTTCPRFMDVFPMNNDWRAARLDSAGGLSIWGQINTVLGNHYFGSACADRYGRVHLQRQQNVLDAATRSSIPTVMTLTRGDWANSINFERRQVDDVGYANFSGVSWDGSTPTAYFSLAPGHTPGQYGSTENPERLVLFNDQTSVNNYAAAYLGWKNNPYPKFPFSMPMNNRMIDIAPYQYIVNNFVTSDTSRGFADSNRRFIPRTIRLSFNKGMQFFTTDVDCEAETPFRLSVTGDTPADPPVVPITPPPVPPPPPPPIPLPSGNGKEVWFAANSDVYWSGDYFAGGAPTWNKVANPVGGTPAWFGITPNGIAYIGTASQLWMATDPKLPNWTCILQVGTAMGGGCSVSVRGFGYIMGPFMMVGNKVYAIYNTNCAGGGGYQYAEHNGTSWGNFSAAIDQGGFNPAGVGPQTVLMAFSQWRAYAMPSWTVLEIYPNGTNISGYVYRTPSGTRLWIQHKSSPNMSYIHTTGVDIQAIGAQFFSAETDRTMVLGAEAGPQVYCVSCMDGANGHLFLSEDGSTFSDVATWGEGWVRDANYRGGGSLVWVLSSVLSSNVPTRLYNRDGTVIRDMTGNFWSLATGNQTITGSGIVY